MKHKFKLRPLAAGMAGGACIALAPGVVVAQGQFPAPTPPDTTLPEVKVKESAPGSDYNPPVATVGGGVPTPIRDIPQSITVVNSALMQAQGATTATSAPRRSASVLAATTTPTPTARSTRRRKKRSATHRRSRSARTTRCRT